VKDYPLSELVPQAKQKLVALGVPVPQPDPKQLAWMQAEAKAQREKPGILSKPMSLIRTGPGSEKIVAARTGTPNMEPETDNTSVADILSGGARSSLGAGGSSNAPGNTAVIAIATPGTGATSGSTVETGDTGGTTDAPAADSNSTTGTAATPADTGSTNPPPAATDSAAATANGNGAEANPATTDPNAKSANNTATDPKKESSSKKKKGLKKVIPW
jgi:outer membrane protein assembly factor BamD